jgi:hypothetical protein
MWRFPLPGVRLNPSFYATLAIASLLEASSLKYSVVGLVEAVFDDSRLRC